MRTRKRRTSTANSLKSCFPIGKSSSVKEAAVEALRNTMVARQALTADTSLADSTTIELTDLSESVSPRSVRRTAAPPPSRSPRLTNFSSSPTGKTVSVIVEETSDGSQKSPAAGSGDLTTVTEQSSTAEASLSQNATVCEPLLSTAQRV